VRLDFSWQKIQAGISADEYSCVDSAPAVRYSDNAVTIKIPSDQATDWGVTDQVGIAANISPGAQGSLALLLEKDFACLDRSDEENQDTFANPNSTAICLPAL